MKFSCNQDTFAKYLSVLSRIILSKPGLPILNNVFLDVSKNKVSMKATDLEVSLNCWIGAEVMNTGKTTVPAKQLSEFVNSIPIDKVDVYQKDNILSVETQKNTAQFNTIVADDFPGVPHVKKGDKPLLKLKKEEVLKAVGRVSFAAAKDDIKPVLTGILIEITRDTISFVATDGLRLSKQVLNLSSEVDQDLQLLVPAKALDELAKIIVDFESEEDDEFVEAYYLEDKNQIIFKYSDIELVSRLIDGQFPEYRQIIPTGFQMQSSFARSEFLNSLKVVNIIARNILGNKIELEIQPEDKKISLSAAQSDIGTNQSEFDIKGEGEELKIAFSGKFLLDVLNNIHEEEMIFECTTPTSPGVFKLKDDQAFVHLIMPMRI
jgi:DNA polymerase III subunit beta